ncbi:hypothetical protein [Methanococcus aeolicus]|uniref:hypothetical protein n=1 Tax=Methanococcus aeolicus TaxID=42879 RepID=UPI0021C8A6CD|nr:hypothetical protein [Methanococcus aeolicus]UXM84569.1 hypothetical protein N6C89_07470 [Methanococcus aeolicus]
MDDFLKIVLFGIIPFWSILLIIVFYPIYIKYKKAKNSWKVLYEAKMDIYENLKYNLKNNLFTNKFFTMIFIIGIMADIFGIIWGIIHKIVSLIFFNGAILLYFIMLFTIFKEPNLLTKFGLKSLKLRNIGICDNGIIYNWDKRAMTWEQFKGYKKNNGYIYLIIKKKPNSASALKYSKELENIIKDFLNEIS